MKSKQGVAFFERHFLPFVFQTYLSSIVVEELYAGALNTGAVRLVEHYVSALGKAARVVTPTFRDWKEAGKLVAQITRKEPGRKTKIQQMLNDILLALSTRRIGADLFTYNQGDFKLIRRYKFFSLKVLRIGVK